MLPTVYFDTRKKCHSKIYFVLYIKGWRLGNLFWLLFFNKTGINELAVRARKTAKFSNYLDTVSIYDI